MSSTDITIDAREAGVLDVDDIQAARHQLIERGVYVSEIWHLEPGHGRAQGVDPERRSYLSRASFTDSGGNTWILQEVTKRLPGAFTVVRTIAPGDGDLPASPAPAAYVCRGTACAAPTAATWANLPTGMAGRSQPVPAAVRFDPRSQDLVVPPTARRRGSC